MILSGKAKVAGVIGWPITHSLSPRLHTYWIEEMKVNGSYVPFAVAPPDFATALRALPKLGIRGANVTVPFKEAAFDVVDDHDAFAERVGAVNTVIVRDDGSLFGRNTDGFGFMENLKSTLGEKYDFAAGPALVLGAGGAAGGILAALIDAGVPDIKLYNRTPDRAKALADRIDGPITPIAKDDLRDALGDAHLLVNSTTCGMKGENDWALDLDPLPRDAVVTDIVYTPLETGLLAKARRQGNPTVDGLGMLLHQARPGFAAWFGKAPRVTDDLRAHLLAGLDGAATKSKAA